MQVVLVFIRVKPETVQVFKEITLDNTRQTGQLTALSGGLALANAGLGAVHGLAGPRKGSRR